MGNHRWRYKYKCNEQNQLDYQDLERLTFLFLKQEDIS